MLRVGLAEHVRRTLQGRGDANGSGWRHWGQLSRQRRRLCRGSR